jgi:hypothetical protein
MRDAASAHVIFLWGGLFITWLTNWLFHTRLTDVPTCYKLIRRDLLIQLPLRCRRFEFCPEVTAEIVKRNIPIAEVPITYQPRSLAEGKKIRLRDAFEAVWTLLRCRWAGSDMHWLLIILFAGFFIRVVGVGYGLPHHLYGDEESVVYTALRMLELRTVLPVFHWEAFRGLSYYPPFLSYIHAFLFLLY